jgi:PAS domain S-box-containing protein
LRVVRDVSAEQRAVEELRRSEERYRVTLSSIGDAVIATDTSGLVTYMNQVAEQLTGWSEREAHLQPLDKVFPLINEETRHLVDNPVARVIREGIVVGLANHSVLIARDGTERPIKDSAAPIRGSSGALSGVVLVFRDVTEERRAEITAEKLAAIVENSDDAIVSKDLNGLITSWNRAAERIFGYRATEVVGRPINMIIPPDRQDEERQILAQLRRGERVEHFETVRLTKDGRPLQVSLTISPIKDAEGHVVGASKIARVIQEKSR